MHHQPVLVVGSLVCKLVVVAVERRGFCISRGNKTLKRTHVAQRFAFVNL